MVQADSRSFETQSAMHLLIRVPNEEYEGFHTESGEKEQELPAV
jgi:hypothetical protein